MKMAIWHIVTHFVMGDHNSVTPIHGAEGVCVRVWQNVLHLFNRQDSGRVGHRGRVQAAKVERSPDLCELSVSSKEGSTVSVQRQ